MSNRVGFNRKVKLGVICISVKWILLFITEYVVDKQEGPRTEPWGTPEERGEV